MVLFKLLVLMSKRERDIKFTFQYGSIQITGAVDEDTYRQYLHSNMVLFKFT